MEGVEVADLVGAEDVEVVFRAKRGSKGLKRIKQIGQNFLKQKDAGGVRSFKISDADTKETLDLLADRLVYEVEVERMPGKNRVTREGMFSAIGVAFSDQAEALAAASSVVYSDP